MFETRRYQVRPGRRAEWVTYMEDVVIPFQSSRGMSVVASFIDDEDPDGYIWIRRFDDDAHRDRAYAAVYDSDRWKNDISRTVHQYLLTDKSLITKVTPTPASPLS